MASFEINGQTYHGPAGWSDLTPAGLLHLARLQPFLELKESAKYLLLKYLFHAQSKMFKLLKESHLIQACVLLDWIYTKNTLSKWLLPKVSTINTDFYGPQSRLADLTAREFAYTEAVYEHWLNDGNEAHLHKLFAILYRKGHWWSGKKLPFDPEKLDKNIEATAGVKLYVKRAVLLNYVGCRNYIISVHPHIWKQAIQAKLNSGAKTNHTHWMEIFMNLAGDKFGTYAQTLQTDVWLVLTDMDMKAKQAEELEAKQ